MTGQHEHVFLLDEDNTRLNNDHGPQDLRRYLRSCLSPQTRNRFVQIFGELRREIGYADYRIDSRNWVQVAYSPQHTSLSPVRDLRGRPTY